MNKKILIVVDMQNDFVSEALANPEAVKVVDVIKEKITGCIEADIPVFFTRDTHGEEYLATQEGRLLPVAHCIKFTHGWELVDELKEFSNENNTLDKPTFGAINFPIWLERRVFGEELASFDEKWEIELCGVCTDICVISNAMILKAAYPETKITVDSKACAGVTTESHETALKAMQACQMNII